MRDNDSGGFEPELPHTMESPTVFLAPSRSSSSTSSWPQQQQQPRPASPEEEHHHEAPDDVPLIRNPPHYDFNPTGTNTLFSVFLVINTILGAGLLNFPKAYDLAGGVFVVISVQTALLPFIFASLVILAYCADENYDGAATTLQDTMKGISGVWGKVLASLSLAVYCFGTCVTFLILIGDQFDRTFASLYGHDFCNHWYLRRSFTIPLCSLLFILPMCFSKRIDFLRTPSLLGVMAVVYIVALIVYEYFAGNFIPGPIKHYPSRWTDVFLVIPDITFSYQCHVSAIPVYSCMKRRTVRSFSMVSLVAVIICAILYTASGALGYLTFGSFVNDDVLMSYSAKRPEVLVGIVAMALKTITTYPIMLFCGREALNSVYDDLLALWRQYQRHQRRLRPLEGQAHHLQQQQPDPDDDAAMSPRQELWRRVILSLVLFVTSLFCAVLIPHIGVVISLLGSLAAVFIFIFPGICLFQVVLRSDPSLFLVKNVFLLIFSLLFLAIGAFIVGVVFTQAVQHLQQDSGDHSTAVAQTLASTLVRSHQQTLKSYQLCLIDHFRLSTSTPPPRVF